MIDAMHIDGVSGEHSPNGVGALKDSGDLVRTGARAAFLAGSVYELGDSLNREFGEGNAKGRPLWLQFLRGGARGAFQISGSYGGGIVGAAVGAPVGGAIGDVPGAAAGTFIGAGIGSYGGASFGDQLFDAFFGE